MRTMRQEDIAAAISGRSYCNTTHIYLHVYRTSLKTAITDTGKGFIPTHLSHACRSTILFSLSSIFCYARYTGPAQKLGKL